jgi:hypothetical protein
MPDGLSFIFWKKKKNTKERKERKPFCLYFFENKKNSSRAKEILEDFRFVFV